MKQEASADTAAKPGSAPALPARSEFEQRALDFAPDLLAIQERPPSRLPRAIGLATVALTALMIAWAAVAKLDIVATAEGRLVPVGYTKVVQPAESGVVASISVKDGDLVRAGDVLLTLDARINAADNTALSRETLLKRLTLQRIEAEMGDLASLHLSAQGSGLGQALGQSQGSSSGSGTATALVLAQYPDLVAQVQGQFAARRQSYADSTAQELAALNRAKAELQAAEQVRQKLEATVPLFQQTAQAHQRLFKEGFIGEIALNEKLRDAVEKEQDLKAQRATIDSLHANITQAQRRLEGIRSTYRSQLQTEKLETLAQLNRSSQELDKTQLRQAQMQVKAPNDGIVKDLAATNPGQVVQAGALLMNLVPKDEQLQAEVLLKNEDAGFVRTGQAAVLKIGAFAFQKFGLVAGEVALVSADAQDPKQLPPGQAPTLTYKAIVKLRPASQVASTSGRAGQDADSGSRATMNRGVPLYATDSGSQLPLQPGMLVAAEIKQGQRTVLEYLLSPVQRIGQEAARER